MFEIDEIDKKILVLYYDNPEISHSDIGKAIERSQPSVGNRVRRLDKMKLLQKCYGCNFKELNFLFIKMDIHIMNPKEIFDIIRDDSRVLNAFRNIGGRYELTLFFYEQDIKKVEKFANNLRKNGCIIHYSFAVDFLRDLILPTDFDNFIKNQE